MRSRISQLITRQFSFFVSLPAVVWLTMFLYIPLLIVLSASFFSEQLPVFTFANFIAVGTWLHIKVMAGSLLLALSVSFLCLLIGYPVAYFFATKMRRFKNLFLFFLMLPFWTNFLVTIYAWFSIIEKNGLINSALLKLGIISEPLSILYTPQSVMLVMVYCYLPFMILPLYSVLEKFDRTLVEASLDLGASPSQTFFKVTLPLSMSGVRNGFFLVFIPVFGEYAIPTILGGGKYLYVGSMIASYYLEARNPALSAAFTVLSCVVVIISTIILYRLLTPAFERKAQAKEY